MPEALIQARLPTPSTAPVRVELPRSALTAAYGDLAALRYDYPLLLMDHGDHAEALLPLTTVFNRCLAHIAPRGAAGEPLRQQGLALEAAIRRLQSGRRPRRLSAVLEEAVASLPAASEGDADAEDSLKRLRVALPSDGRLLDCTGETPMAVVRHLWLAEFARKMTLVHARISRLARRLADVLRAAELASPAGRQPRALERAMGSSFREVFDYKALAGVLDTPNRRGGIPALRQKRIESVLDSLRNQRLFAADPAAVARHWQFRHCQQAMDAFRDRLPELVGLLRAMRIAELELEHGYREALHDHYFEAFNEDDLRLEDFAQMPPLLVFSRNPDAVEQTAILQALDSSLPVKILVQHDDILSDHPLAAGKFSLGAHGGQLGRMALSLDNAFVLQAGSSHLYRVRAELRRGLGNSAPALFNVNSGAADGDVPPYLMAAAATEARAFPLFCHDPEAGHDWAGRFRLLANPQPDRDWPRYRLQAEDDRQHRTEHEVSFTFADFATLDSRYTHHFAPVDVLSTAVVSVEQWLANPANDPPAVVELVDYRQRLQCRAVDDALLHATRRCAEAWHNLQELGGIHNSHAERLLAAERARLQAATAPAAEPPSAPITPVPATNPADTPATTEDTATEAGDRRDEAYIETPRCTTCEECVLINDRLFAYDDNKQAYIADLAAGSYRELVEAAESCQVAIIHPGLPLNPNEPGLDELLERAEPFR